jgi:hypothetical protein
MWGEAPASPFFPSNAQKNLVLVRHPDNVALEQRLDLPLEAAEVQRLADKAVKAGCTRSCFVLLQDIRCHRHDPRWLEPHMLPDAPQDGVAIFIW